MTVAAPPSTAQLMDWTPEGLVSADASARTVWAAGYQVPLSVPERATAGRVLSTRMVRAMAAPLTPAPL